MDNLLGLGLQPKDLGVLQVCLRGIIVFFVALIMLRVANRRFMAKLSAFDALLGFVLASMLARAINGSAPFVPTLVVGFVLVLLHAVLAALSFHVGWIGKLIKGEPHVLIEHGKVDSRALRSHKISEADLLEELRLHGKLNSVAAVERATIERNGKISVLASSGE